MPLIDYGRIVGRAAYYRHRCGFFGKEPSYSTNELQSLGFPDVAIMSHDLPGGVIEMVTVHRGRRTVYYNRSATNEERRVGIVHGLHHLLDDLRGGQDARPRECNAGLRDLRADGKVPQNAVELGCDLFAAEILIPFDVLDQFAPPDLTAPPPNSVAEFAFRDEVDRLASRFKVPADFMRWRLADLAHLRRTSLLLK